MEQNKLKRFERILKISFFVIVFIICTMAIMNSCESCSAQKNNDTQYITNDIYYANYLDSTCVSADTVTERTQSIVKDELIDEVQKYMNSKTNKYHQLIPNYLVLAGLKNDIDICFMMAQTEIETCYGTLGAGRERSRRSLFGIAVHKYSNYENAVNHYCEVLQKYYLKNGRTEQHLMNKYVTMRGARYAENPNYEQTIKAAYNRIKKHTNIYDLQQEYKNMS